MYAVQGQNSIFKVSIVYMNFVPFSMMAIPEVPAIISSIYYLF
jgi:hypothetical protein